MEKTDILISVSEALDIVLAQATSFGIEEIGFEASLGRVLKEEIIADRDMPPFDRVSMDGIAIKTEVFNSGTRHFPIENTQAAGSPRCALNNEVHCIEAMTGAMLPEGCDAVIPYERIRLEKGVAHVQVDEISFFQNIHKKGLDRKKGELLVPENTVIRGAETGVLATVGKTTVKVARLPKVAIVSTGDELVGVDDVPAPYQIRKSNVYTLDSVLKNHGIKAGLFHISDEKEQLKQQIAVLLEQNDVLLFSGGVSKGKFDFLPEVLIELGVEKYFHKVSQRPGKPFWFGKNKQATIFAFPGNPVSTFVSCLKYFVPWLHKGLELDPEIKDFAVLAEDFSFKPQLTCYLQVKVYNENGLLKAVPDAGNGSGDLANLTKNNAFIELPPDRNEFRKGDVYPILSFKY